MNMRTAKLLLLGASVATLAASPAFAASTADQQVELVTVTAARTSTTGLVDEHISKQRSTITQAFFDTQPAGQTIFQGLNMVPGLNFTNSDPYGSSGGNIRLHGQDGARISFTWDGMPLNDTGNYAIYTNQVVDSELVDNVIVNQGTTDVDTPTASAVGGVIGITTTKPADNFAVMTDLSYGSFNYKRGFIRVDSGEIGPWGTKALLSYSYQDYDKFKGPGNLAKQQINGLIYQDLGSTGFFNIGFHFNRNRNFFYNNVSYLPIGQGAPGLAVSAPNVALDANGNYAPYVPGGLGLNTDEDPTCTPYKTGAVTYTTPIAGSPDFGGTSPGGTTGNCTGFYRLRINPSDTGNIRASSLFHINDVLSLTVDPWFQYVLANGGGVTVINETDPRLKGQSAAAGVDLNGDGDTLDQVQVYSPNNTNTRRYGVTLGLIYAPDDNNVVQLGYSLDWGLHRQTGEMSRFDSVTGPADVFGGLRKNHVNAIRTADGLSDLRQRDRKSYAILNQFSLAYNGKYWDDLVRMDIGLRLPYLQRDLNQYCYLQAKGGFSQITPGVGFQYCTTETPSAVAPDGTVTFAGLPATAGFTPPAHKVVRYNRLLPNVGVTYRLNHQDTHQFFFAYATELSAPRTDNLYNGGVTGFGTPAVHYSPFAVVAPETSTSYDLGYRYHGDSEHLSVTLWNSQFRNRIVSTFDPAQGISIDHNIGTVNMAGFDVDGGVDLDDAFSIFGTFSYLKTRVVNNLPINATVTLPTAGKQLVESPNYMSTLRAQYTMWGFRFGLDGKFVGSRYATDVNDYKVPSYYTADADITYDFSELGWDGSYLKFNVSNIFDEKYFGSVATSRTCFTPVAPTTAGCTSYPLLTVGFPRTFQVTLRTVF